MSDKRPIRYVVNPKPKAPEPFPEGSWDLLRLAVVGTRGGYSINVPKKDDVRVTH